MQGLGTQDSPYLVSTPQDLDAIRNNKTAYYQLTNDIDMSSFGNWYPIANNTTTPTSFSGSIDGKGYKIKNLTANHTGVYSVSFIGATNTGAVIKNIGLENINISSTTSYTGSIISGFTQGTMENCYATGIVNGNGSIGGLVASSYQSTIKNCYSTCSVTSTQYGTVGGLIGTLTGGTLENSYSTGKVTAVKTPYGGLIGATSGTPTITNSYWDTQTSGQTTSAGGTGKTSTEMKTQSTYVNWDFTNTWVIQNDYPTLRVFGVPVVANIGNVTVNSFVKSIQSNLINSKKSTIQLKSYSYPFIDSLNVRRNVLRSVETYLSNLHANATESHRIVLNAIRQVDSYVNPIYSKVATFYPIDDVPTFGEVLAIENNSTISHSDNMSRSSYIINPSMVEVI